MVNGIDMAEVNKDIYDYVQKSKPHRILFYLKLIITFGVFIVSELIFYRQYMSFSVIGCQLSVVNGTTYVNGSYSLSTCIEYNVSQYIPVIYDSSVDSSIVDQESLSFQVPFVMPNNYVNSTNNLIVNPTRVAIQMALGNIWIMYGFVIGIAITFLFHQSILNIRNNRILTILSMNLVFDDKDKRVVFLVIGFLIVQCIGYTIGKAIVLSNVIKAASVIYFSNGALFDFNNITINLLFENKTTSILSLTFLVNFLVMLTIFKDPILDLWYISTDYYSNLRFQVFLNSVPPNSYQHLKDNLVFTNENSLKKIMSQYVEKHYPNESKFRKYRRIQIFLFFKSSKSDIYKAIQEYKDENPNEFLPLSSYPTKFTEKSNLLN